MTVTRRGDIWLLGDHRLMCGDATSRADVERLLDGERAALCLTDPPYGTRKHVQKKSDGSIGQNTPRKLSMGLRDTTYVGPPATPFPLILGDEDTSVAKAAIPHIMALSDAQIVWGGNFFADFLPPSRCWLIWDKQNTGAFADAELAWTSFDKPVKLYRFLWNGLMRKGSHTVNPVPRVHPTQKSVELHMDILSDFSQSGDVVLDCFGGSGTTLIACDQTGRQCRMMELSEAYVDIIVERWLALHPMERAVLEESGETFGAVRGARRRALDSGPVEGLGLPGPGIANC